MGYLYGIPPYKSIGGLQMSGKLSYNQHMDRKTERIEIRVTTAERAAFSEAASWAGIPLASWMRERLRLAAIRELENAGRRVPFIAPVPLRAVK
jgi:hypothetical protein